MVDVPQLVQAPVSPLPPTTLPPVVAPQLAVQPTIQKVSVAFSEPAVSPISNPTIAPVKKNWLPYIIVVVILILIGAGVALAAKYQLLPFNKSVYTPENFFLSILSKVSTIDSAAYKASFSLKVADRDNGARPFQVIVTNTAALREQYQHDSQRAQNISSLISMLRDYSYYVGQAKSSSVMPVPYPVSLKKLVADAAKKSPYYKNTTITDPVTDKEYDYQVIDGGKDFNLTATFETDAAIASVRRAYGYVATTTIVSGKNVTFTKNSIYYFYLPTEPPKPLLVGLGESLRQLPADVNVLFDAGAQADFTDGFSSANWLAEFNAEGSFGDLSYKVNAEARKKDTDYYLRINNIPSIVGAYSSLKGKWIKISTEVATSSTRAVGYSQFDYLSRELQSLEKTYKEERHVLSAILKKAAEIAGQEKLIDFKIAPRRETVDGRNLTRYELQIRKEAILPFYQKLIAGINEEGISRGYPVVADQGLLEYLQSKEFDEVFDYVNKNTTLTFWTDSRGYPAIIEEGLRIIPPDTAVQLKDKQVNVRLRLTLNDINKSVNIEVPAGAIPLSEAMAEFEKNQ